MRRFCADDDDEEVVRVDSTMDRVAKLKATVAWRLASPVVFVEVD